MVVPFSHRTLHAIAMTPGTSFRYEASSVIGRAKSCRASGFQSWSGIQGGIEGGMAGGELSC